MDIFVAVAAHGLPHGGAGGMGDGLEEHIQQEEDNNWTKRNADYNNKD